MLHSFPFHFCVVNFLWLSCLCLGWWPKEPAGLKTLRLVSMPSWRHANSEEQEEEDDDDVVGPPGVAASRLALQGHQRVRGSLGLPQLSYNHLLPHPPGIFGSQRKWLKLIVPHATVRWSWSGNCFACLRKVGTKEWWCLEVSSSFVTWRPIAFWWPCCVAWVQIAELWKIWQHDSELLIQTNWYSLSTSLASEFSPHTVSFVFKTACCLQTTHCMEIFCLGQ